MQVITNNVPIKGTAVHVLLSIMFMDCNDILAVRNNNELTKLICCRIFRVSNMAKNTLKLYILLIVFLCSNMKNYS